MNTNTELQTAVNERRAHGYSDEQIKEELYAAGYDEAVVSQILQGEFTTDYSVGDEVEIPRVGTLINNGLAYVKERYDLGLMLAAPMIVLSALEYLNEVYTENTSLALASVVVALISIITYFVLYLGTMYTVCHDANREIETKEAMTWSRQNIMAYFWVALLSGLVVWGGLVLLIVPGIVLSFYLFLSQYVFVMEGKRGVAALQRSFDLIKGYWWQLAGRLLLLGLIFFAVFLVIGGLLAVGTEAIPESLETVLLGDVLVNIVSGFLTVFNFTVGLQIYQSLVKRSIQSNTQDNKLMKGLIGLGVVAAVGLIVLSIWSLVMMGTQGYLQEDNVNIYDATSTIESQEAKERAEALRLEN